MTEEPLDSLPEFVIEQVDMPLDSLARINLVLESAMRTNALLRAQFDSKSQNRKQDVYFYRKKWRTLMWTIAYYMEHPDQTTYLSTWNNWLALRQDPADEISLVLKCLRATKLSREEWEEAEDELNSNIYQNPFYWENFD